MNEYSEYNDMGNQVPWKKVIFTIIGFVLIVIIILLVLRACQGGGNLNEKLVEAGKDYYTNYPNQLPTEVGECNTVELQTLVAENLLKGNTYNTCDGANTYVKVCLLEDNSYHYVGILLCDDEISKFGMWQDGTLADLVPDKTDVRFKFLGQQLSLGTKYYYPGNNQDVTQVIEYYASAPDPEFTGKEDEQTGYKWYVTKSTTDYYNNGEYSSTQPSGYPNKGESKTETNFSTTKPADASYRTIEATTLYRTQKIAYQYKWYCYANAEHTGAAMVSQTPCAIRTDSFIHMRNADYTCDGTNKVDVGTICQDWTDWSTTACQSSVLNGTNCETQSGYYYTDTKWQWYKTGTANYYYPSNSTSAQGENTYYVTAPVSGAVRDDSTATTVYKYYKVVKDDNTLSTNVEEWVDVTDGYVNILDLLSKFQELGYDVNSLSDINANDEIRYQYQMQYRNVEE